MILSESIVAALRYCAHFDYPLTLEEIVERLIECKAGVKQVKSEVAKLVEKGMVGKVATYYFLPGYERTVNRREKREKLSEPLIGRAKEYAILLGRFPGVRAVYLTGSLAMANSTGDDDIDLMIIAENGKVWTTRLILTLYTGMRGIRRTPVSRNNKGKLCLNLYMSPAGFAVPESRRSLYTAYELVQAVPLFDPRSTRTALLGENKWINTYLPNVRITSDAIKEKSARYNLLEKACFTVQKLYMSRRMTREYVSIDCAFFHPQNPGAKLTTMVEG